MINVQISDVKESDMYLDTNNITFTHCIPTHNSTIHIHIHFCYSQIVLLIPLQLTRLPQGCDKLDQGNLVTTLSQCLVTTLSQPCHNAVTVSITKLIQASMTRLPQGCYKVVTFHCNNLVARL